MSTIPYHNDRFRVYGLVMNRPNNREVYRILAEGAINRRHLDGPLLGLKKVY